jgi:ribosome-interacting GTPase 1
MGQNTMPTNLSPQCLAARRRYMQADTPNEKMDSLREYISLVPRHKGTERLLRQLRSKLSKLEGEAERRRSLRKGSGAVSAFHIKKEGAGQVTLVGLTTSGRSSLLRWFTNAKPEVSPLSFKTRIPVPGMMDYEDILVQLVEVPAIYEDIKSGKGLGPQIIAAIRNSDAVALTIDLSRDAIQQMDLVLKELHDSAIRLNQQPPRVDVEKTGSGGVQIFGISLYKDDVDELKEILGKYSHNIKVRLNQPTTRSEILEAINPRIAYKKAIVIATKGDVPGSSENFKALEDKYRYKFPMIAVSVEKNRGKDELKQEIFKALDVIRVYTKEPREKPSEKPIVLKKDARITDLVRRLPRVFQEQFKYAKVVGPSAKFDREFVGANHVLQDKDVVQVYVS